LQDAIRKLSYDLFHEHKQVPDQELKSRMKAKLDADDYCVNQLRKLREKGSTYDQIWDQKIYSAVSTSLISIGYCIY
jgi:hypothetical protein